MKIKIDDVLNHFTWVTPGETGPVVSGVVRYAQRQHRETLRIILEKMAALSVAEKRNTYSVYAPHLDFGLPLSRRVVGEALGCLWEYCIDKQIPHLNYLVVRQDTGLPGEGVQSWYVDQFGSLSGFDEWCAAQVSLCLLIFRHSLVEIV